MLTLFLYVLSAFLVCGLLFVAVVALMSAIKNKEAVSPIPEKKDPQMNNDTKPNIDGERHAIHEAFQLIYDHFRAAEDKEGARSIHEAYGHFNGVKPFPRLNGPETEKGATK